MLVENGLSVYFVTGDHDNMDSRYLADMQNLGAHLMNYETLFIIKGENKMEFILRLIKAPPVLIIISTFTFHDLS